MTPPRSRNSERLTVEAPPDEAKRARRAASKLVCDLLEPGLLGLGASAAQLPPNVKLQLTCGPHGEPVAGDRVSPVCEHQQGGGRVVAGADHLVHRYAGKLA